MNIDCPDPTDEECMGIKENHSLLLEAMEAIPDAFYMLDMNWRFLFLNRAAEQFFGTPKESALGQYYLEVWPEARGTEVFHTLASVYAEQKPVEREMMSARRPGSLVCFSAVPLSSGGVAVTVKDITHRAEHQQQMEEGRKRLDSMLESTSDNVLLLDRYSVVQFANARALSNLKLTPDKVIGKPIYDVIPEIRTSPIMRMLVETLESQVSKSFVHHSASLGRWYDITAYPSQSGLAVFYKDITYQRKNDEKLAASERQFRELSESMPQLVWKADRGGNRTWFNRQWLQLTGMTLEESRGWGWLAAHHPDDHAEIKQTLRDSLRDKKPWSGNWRIRSKDGNYRWYLTRCTPVFATLKDNITHWIGTCTDITDSIKDKEHQELLLHELNHRVKNTLAIIQSIGRNSSGTDVKSFRKLFESRLLALSKTHDLLTESDWNSAPLRGLIESELAPYVGASVTRQHRLEGPDVNLKPQVVVPLGMAIHELATNAAKYGSLSTTQGKVVIRWCLVDTNGRDMVRIHWIESGGPPVEQPDRKGFGTRLMQHSFRGDFGGSVALNYLPEGFQCVMEIPAEHMVDETTERTLFRIKKAVA